MLTLERAKELNATMVSEPHLITHALSVSAAMGAMAEHFGEDKEHWMAIGYLHDYDYEKYPEEHLQHTKEPLLAAGLEEDEVRAILAHGYGLCSDVEPITNMEKSLYTVDELTGIVHVDDVHACRVVIEGHQREQAQFLEDRIRYRNNIVQFEVFVGKMCVFSGLLHTCFLKADSRFQQFLVNVHRFFLSHFFCPFLSWVVTHKCCDL